MSDMPSPSWLDDFITAAYEYAEQTSAENISRSSGGIVVPARRQGFDLDMLVMDEADTEELAAEGWRIVGAIREEEK